MDVDLFIRFMCKTLYSLCKDKKKEDLIAKEVIVNDCTWKFLFWRIERNLSLSVNNGKGTTYMYNLFNNEQERHDGVMDIKEFLEQEIKAERVNILELEKILFELG